MDDMDGAEWTIAAVGPDKRRLSERLISACATALPPAACCITARASGIPANRCRVGLLAVFWRKDGVPVWENAALIADVDHDYGLGPDAARRFARHFANVLGVSAEFIIPAYEDVAHYLLQEQRLPVNVDPADPRLQNPEERARMARVFQQGIGEPIGFVMPLKPQMWQWLAPHGNVQPRQEPKPCACP